MIDAGKKIRGLMKERGMNFDDLAAILSRQLGTPFTANQAKNYIQAKRLKGEKLLLFSRIFLLDPLELADQVTVALAERGITKKRAAEMMGMSKQSFNGFAGRIRKGQSTQTRLIVRISKITGKPQAYFMPGGSIEK